MVANGHPRTPTDETDVTDLQPETLERPCVHCGNATAVRDVGYHDKLICTACNKIATRGYWAKKPNSPKRRPMISNSRRARVLQRDGYRCRHCGRTASEARLEPDHVIPVSVWEQHGKDLPSFVDCECNLQTLCADCNNGKRDHVFVADVHQHIALITLAHRHHTEVSA